MLGRLRRFLFPLRQDRVQPPPRSRLVANLYGPDTGQQSSSQLFGLQNFQTRHGSVFYEAFWCNEGYEFIGRGDLSLDDLFNIKNEIRPGEAFVVVGATNNKVIVDRNQVCRDAQLLITSDGIFLLGSAPSLEGILRISTAVFMARIEKARQQSRVGT